MTDQDLELFDRVVHDVRGAVGTATQALLALAKLAPEDGANPLAQAGGRTLARLLRRTETAAAVHRLRTKSDLETVMPLGIPDAVVRAVAEANALGPRHPLIAPDVRVRSDGIPWVKPLPPRLFSAVLAEFLALGLRHAHGPSHLDVSAQGKTATGPNMEDALTFRLEVPLHPRGRLTSVDDLAEDDHVPLALLRLGAHQMGGSFTIEGPPSEPRSTLLLELP